jgi:hypothetical protein
MVQEGLKTAHQQEFAQQTAEKYYNACLTAYLAQKTVNENLAPDKPMGFGARDFVGWGGIGPVANLVEYILGFDINAPEHTIIWRINRLERHGLENLVFDGFKVDMICDARAAAGNPCHITVTSGGPFLLKIIVGLHTTEKEIRAGTQTFSL